jgi:transposase
MTQTQRQQVVSKTKKSKTKSADSGLTIGIDLGDRWSHYCVLNESGEIVEEGRFRTTPEALAKHFDGLGKARIAMEAGVHSIWINEKLREFGHEVIVANVQELYAICRSDRKCDRADAEKLARYARLDPEVLRPIQHRSVAQQEALTLIRARDVMVRVRTALSNALRGLAKPCGYRLPSPLTKKAAQRCLDELPKSLHPALGPMIQQIQRLSDQIRVYDRQIVEMTQKSYPETQALVRVHGVGGLTAMTFVLTLGEKERFRRSRDVGPYLGLRPRRKQTGGSDPQLRITKAGNRYLRKLLVECANFILGPFGQDSELRRWGLRLAERGGTNARKRAKVAVARRLAVLLHRLWVTQAKYQPFYVSAAA